MTKLTERDQYGNADIIGVDSGDLQLSLEFDEFNCVADALNKLAAYEDTNLAPAEIAAMQTELAQLKEAQRWIPVNKELPAEGQEVEIMEIKEIYTAKYEPNNNQFLPWQIIDSPFFRPAERVTHWRKPLPIPPANIDGNAALATEGEKQ